MLEYTDAYNEEELRVNGRIVIADESMWCFDENDIVDYVTIFIDGVPKWKKVFDNDSGFYIKIGSTKEYILEKCQ